MKLIKKLLPVASLASVAAVAAPLATTSCSNTGKVVSYSFSYDAENPEEIAEYKPKFEALPQQTPYGYMDIETAQLLYFDQMKKDPSLYADDLMCAMYDQIYEEVYFDWYDKIDGNIQVCVDSFEPTEFVTDSGGPLMGGYVNGYIKSNYTFTCSDEYFEFSYDGYVNRKISFTHLPIMVYPYVVDVLVTYGVTTIWDDMFDDDALSKYYKNTSISYVDECKRGDAVLNNDITWTLDNQDASVTKFNIWSYTDQYVRFDLEDLIGGGFSVEYWTPEFRYYGWNGHYLSNNVQINY